MTKILFTPAPAAATAPELSAVDKRAMRAIQRMLTTMRRNDHRPALHYAWIDAQGRQCSCDGFRAYRLNTPLPLEPRPANVGDGVDLDKIVPDISRNYEPIPLPTTDELQSYASVEREADGRKAKLLWDFGPGRPVVNIPYLIDLMAIFPEVTHVYVSTTNGPVSPLYVQSERGDAILLPVRCTDESRERNRRHHFDLLAAKYLAAVEANADAAFTLEGFAALARVAWQP